MRRKRELTLLFVIFVVLVIVAPALAVGRTPPADVRAEAGADTPLAAATATTYWYTGTEQIYLVPAGTTMVTITAAGAIGGADWYNAKPGGGRAVVTATVPLPAGTTTLYVVVGGPGSSPVSDRSGAPGGFNGGGASITSWGGSGGGASDVRTEPISVALTDADSRLVVAGGGGGAGSGQGSGGDAGSAGLAGVTGAGAGGSGSDASATGAAAGNGGFGGAMGGSAGALAPSSTGSAAGVGQLGQGGAGSAGWFDFFSTYVTFAGGGGGGYFGGGGGGDGTYGGGGGAGSSYWVGSAVDTSMTQSVGDAYVSITPPSALPEITGFSPTSGPVGTAVTLTGTGFTGATAVKFGGTAATSYSVVGDTQIAATVPAGATSGTISVTSPVGTATSAGTFTITSPKPVLSRLSPTSGKRGIIVTLTGRAFGSKRGTSYVKFGTVKCGTYVSWSSTKIRCKVPAKAGFGKRYVRVTTGGGTSNAKVFTVKR